MNETQMLALGQALARTTDILRPGEQIPFRDTMSGARWTLTSVRSRPSSAIRPSSSLSTAARLRASTPWSPWPQAAGPCCTVV